MTISRVPPPPRPVFFFFCNFPPVDRVIASERRRVKRPTARGHRPGGTTLLVASRVLDHGNPTPLWAIFGFQGRPCLDDWSPGCTLRIPERQSPVLKHVKVKSGTTLGCLVHLFLSYHLFPKLLIAPGSIKVETNKTTHPVPMLTTGARLCTNANLKIHVW